MRANVTLLFVVLALGLADAVRRRVRSTTATVTTTTPASFVGRQLGFAEQPEELETLWDNYDIQKLDSRSEIWKSPNNTLVHHETIFSKQYPGFPINPGDTNELPSPISPQPSLPPQKPPPQKPPPQNPPSQKPSPPGCLGSRGQYSSLKSCADYLNCWDDVVIEQTCPTGLLFNDITNVCDFPYNVKCGERPPATPKPPLPAGSKLCPDPNGRYRSSTNCSEFYVCVAGKPCKFSCPGGLVYNDILGICDYTYNVDCKGTATPRPTQPPSTQSSQLPSNPPTYAPQPSSSNLPPSYGSLPTKPPQPPSRPTRPPPTKPAQPPSKPTQPPTQLPLNPAQPPSKPPTYAPQSPTYAPPPQPPSYAPPPQPPSYAPQPQLPSYGPPQPPTYVPQPRPPQPPNHASQSPTYAPPSRPPSHASQPSTFAPPPRPPSHAPQQPPTYPSPPQPPSYAPQPQLPSYGPQQPPTYAPQPQPPSHASQSPTYAPPSRPPSHASQPPTSAPPSRPPSHAPQQPPTYAPSSQAPTYAPPPQPPSYAPQPQPPSYGPQQPPSYAPQLPSYQPQPYSPLPPPHFSNPWLTKVETDPWDQQPAASQSEIEKKRNQAEVSDDKDQPLSNPSVQDTTETPTLPNPWTFFQVIPPELMNTPCNNGDLHRLNDSCTNVVVCRNNKLQMVKCLLGFSYDRPTDSCRPISVAKC